MREIEISEEPIELYKILKLENMVDSGGEAKYVISEGQVILNGKVETRKRKKIFSGDVVEFGKMKIRIQVKWECELGGLKGIWQRILRKGGRWFQNDLWLNKSVQNGSVQNVSIRLMRFHEIW